MKKIFTFLIFLSAVVINAQIPAYVPTNGLVGYWPFNGNANDESGNGNNGNVTGATLTSDRFGNNNCYNFNVNNWSWGTGGDEIYIPFNSIFNSANITVSAWFMKTSNGTQNQSLNIINRFQFGYDNPNGQTWGIQLPFGANTPLWTSVIQASNQNNQQTISAVGSQIALNTWYNVVFSFDGQELKQYINGVLITSNSLPGFTLNTVGNSGISIGVSDQANGHWSPFGGKIDDIGMWNRALTQQEITSLYNSTLPQTTCLPSYVPTNGLVGYWPFCGNANDESGTGNNGTVNGATLAVDRFGNADSAYSFDGNADNVIINNSNSLNPSQLSISVWYLALGNDMCVISKNNPSDAFKFSYNIKHQDIFEGNLGLNVGWGIGNCNTANEFWGSNGQIPTNQWVNVILTIDASGVGKVYYNSNLISTYNGAVLQSCNDPLSILKFGGPHWNNDSEWFNGKIDDVGMWNRALTQQEITNLYNSSLPQTTCLPAYVPANGLVGYWPFCGNANDESGNGNNGTVNGATLTNDRFGNSDNAFYFSGSGCSTRIDAQVNTSSIQAGLTISTWLLQSGDGCWSPRILEFRPSNDLDGPGMAQWGWPNGENTIVIGSITSTGFDCSSVITGVVNNQWIHVVYTNDGLIGKFYKNGVLTSSVNSNGNPILAGNVAFGRMNHPAYDALEGKLDDIGIWNRALTQQEIASLYTATLNTNAVSQNNEISIYPNPVKDRVTIDCSNLANVMGYQIKIVNTLGQEVYSGAMNTPQVVVPINSWSGTGVYFVKIYDASNSLLHTKKIIVQ